jgi:hypothetical protein
MNRRLAVVASGGVKLLILLAFGLIYGTVRTRISDGHWWWQDDPAVVQRREVEHRRWLDNLHRNRIARPPEREVTPSYWNRYLVDEDLLTNKKDDNLIRVKLEPGDPDEVPEWAEHDRFGLWPMMQERWRRQLDAEQAATSDREGEGETTEEPPT